LAAAVAALEVLFQKIVLLAAAAVASTWVGYLLQPHALLVLAVLAVLQVATVVKVV
jgi:hypothetical protein